MSRQIFNILCSLVFSFSVFAQTSEKIRGNKNVKIIQTDIKPFHTIAVDEDFEINLMHNDMPSVVIETDENLHEFIKFNVTDSVLTFDKTIKISSKKRLNITVNYNNNLNTIKTLDSAEIIALTTMDLANTKIITDGASRAELTIKTSNFNFQSKGKAKVKLNLNCNNAILSLLDNSKIDALIYAPITKIDLYQRAKATIEGETNEFDLRTDSNSQFYGKNFTAKTCQTLNEASSNATLEVMDTITVDASGNSSVYLYGNPKIIIKKLSNTSKLQKKEK